MVTEEKIMFTHLSAKRRLHVFTLAAAVASAFLATSARADYDLWYFTASSNTPSGLGMRLNVIPGNEPSVTLVLGTPVIWYSVPAAKTVQASGTYASVFLVNNAAVRGTKARVDLLKVALDGVTTTTLATTTADLAEVNVTQVHSTNFFFNGVATAPTFLKGERLAVRVTQLTGVAATIITSNTSSQHSALYTIDFQPVSTAGMPAFAP